MRYTHSQLVALCGAFLMLDVESAYSAAFMVRENSAASVATVNAGNASRADSAATVFNNPAGMSFLGSSQIEVGSSVVFPDMHFSGDATIAGTPIPGDNSRNVGQVAMIPHIYGVYQINDRFSAGVAITVPFGNTVNYSEDWSGRYVNIKTAAVTLDINPNVSYRINDRISVAAGFSAQYLRLQLSSAIAQFVIFGPGTPDGGFLLDADDWAWGYNLGILAQVTDTTRVGLTYRSGISHTITGRLNIWPTTSPLLGLTTAPASSAIDVPATTTLSVTHQITPNFSLSSDLQFNQWHTFKEVTVVAPPNPPTTFQQGYRDSWMVSIGGVYRLNDVWTLRGGVGFDQSPVVDAFRDTGVPDKDRYMLGFGVGYNFSDTMSVDFGYAHYFAAGHASMNSSVNRIDHITGIQLNGAYDNALDHVSIGFRKAF